MYSLVYYIPPSDHERVKQLLFEQGAGKMGDYDQSCWQVRGTGQFRPLSGSHPGIGQVGRLEQLEEYRVEMVCADDRVQQIVETLIKEHPYEQPAYQLCRILTLQELGE